MNYKEMYEKNKELAAKTTSIIAGLLDYQAELAIERVELSKNIPFGELVKTKYEDVPDCDCCLICDIGRCGGLQYGDFCTKYHDRLKERGINQYEITIKQEAENGRAGKNTT